MKPRPLPGPIGSVGIPFFLSPSRFPDLEECPLRALVRPKAHEALPPGPDALLGSLLHHVREQVVRGRWGTARTASSAFTSILAATALDLDRQLAEDERTSGITPLRTAVGRTRWNTRLFEGVQWTNGLDVVPTGEQPLPFVGPTDGKNTGESSAPDNDRLEIGPEAWIVSRRRRLRGRADRIVETDNGTIEVYEYKSAAILEADGDVRERHELQLWLYAVAVEEVKIGFPVRLYLEAGGRLRVRWDDAARESILARLSEMLARFPADAAVDARTLARPGSACVGCPLRPACRAYLEQVPRWWLNSRDAPRPLPLDAWGTIESMDQEEGFITLEVLDAGGRRVRIEQLAPGRLGDLQAGDTVFFFDLEPTEPTLMHGILLQPRNFHEFPPDGGLTFRRARRLQVYVG